MEGRPVFEGGQHCRLRCNCCSDTQSNLRVIGYDQDVAFASDKAVANFPAFDVLHVGLAAAEPASVGTSWIELSVNAAIGLNCLEKCLCPLLPLLPRPIPTKDWNDRRILASRQRLFAG